MVHRNRLAAAMKTAVALIYISAHISVHAPFAATMSNAPAGAIVNLAERGGPGASELGEPHPKFAANEDRDAEAARAKLKEELNRIRSGTSARNHEKAFYPPLPVRRKAPNAAKVSEVNSPLPIDPELERHLSRMLIFAFEGQQSSDPGVKSVRALMKEGAIAGVILDGSNIVSRVQIRDLMKALVQSDAPVRPIIAVRDTGGADTPFGMKKGFVFLPSEQELVAKGNPQYAYSTYQTLAANLAAFGFTLNIGPSLQTAPSAEGKSDGFGGDPQQIALYAKTFLLGHNEAGITSAPYVDKSQGAAQVLKSLLASYPDLAVASDSPTIGDPLSILMSTGVFRGARLCLMAPNMANLGEKAVANLRLGCDALIVSRQAEKAHIVRQHLALSIDAAVLRGELTIQQLAASAQRIDALRGKGAAISNRRASNVTQSSPR